MQQIQSGHGDTIVAGGCESMSRSIFYLPPSTRYEAHRMGDIKLIDSFIRGGECAQPPRLYPNNSMGMTAENVAEKLGITREEMDRFALESQEKALLAIAGGKFQEEITPFTVTDKKGTETVFATDEHPRPGLSMEKLAKLPPAFKKDGFVSAGNSSGMNDGASAVVLMGGDSIEKYGVKPMMEVVDYTVTGTDPRLMGLAPVDAVKAVLTRTGHTLQEIDLFELNEAFAAQSLGVLKELGMEPGTPLYSRVNVNGGAIALGHALGNSGSRIIITLMYELLRQNKRLGIATLCIGGGQGMAILLKNAWEE
jgi:acetyl-CoA C-acetyltransferase